MGVACMVELGINDVETPSLSMLDLGLGLSHLPWRCAGQGEQPVLLFFAEIFLCSLLSAAALPRSGKGWLRVSDPLHPVRVTGLVRLWW